jgi:hypothetical protein
LTKTELSTSLHILSWENCCNGLFKEGRSLRTLEDDNTENINNYYEEREIGEEITKEKGIEIKFLSKIFHKYLLRMISVEIG